jgi:hypothetical protein
MIAASEPTRNWRADHESGHSDLFWYRTPWAVSHIPFLKRPSELIRLRHVHRGHSAGRHVMAERIARITERTFLANTNIDEHCSAVFGERTRTHPFRGVRCSPPMFAYDVSHT